MQGMQNNQNMAPQQAGGAAPNMSVGSPEPSGLRPVSEIGFNQDVQNIVLSRIQTMTPEEEAVLDAVITPQTIGVFVKILPELKPLFDMMGAGGPPQNITAPAGPPQAVPGGPSGPSSGLMGGGFTG